MTDSIIIMAAGTSSRMKKSFNNNILSKNKIKSIDSKSKVLIEFGNEPKPFISYSISNIIESGFINIYIITSEKSSLFRNNFKEILKIDLSNCNIFFSIQYLPSNREKPLGTADAIFQTMEQFPLLKSKSFCVCNGDNLYSIDSLKEIKNTQAKNAFIAFDREGLKFNKKKILSFSIAKMNEKNYLIDIVEKPSKILKNKFFDVHGKIRVSMNLFKFEGEICYTFFKYCPLNKIRNEKEITDVLKNLILDNKKSILGISIYDNVLDLTSKKDIIEVQKYLS